ncbi:hypothetical protein [Nocardiopsis suaedae]|uniref:Uncharacterized protein n=1 Tax=Nocardiopsis suaedae TaxID=3018444 RepID=A0ABT4THU9_9ACTN|nr:hypothetical protein [Nocardiopsis suaedae]MDA2804283.1 hypothetical protein [Nocardiopsis suaedae]
MSDSSPDSSPAPESQETSPTGRRPAWWSDRRYLIGGGVALGLAAAVSLGVYATPPAAYESIGDCDELLKDAVGHVTKDDVKVVELEPAFTAPPTAEDDTGPEYSACGGWVGEGELVVDITLYSPDTAASDYKPVKERLAAVRESADEGPEDGSEKLAGKDIEVGDEGFATLYKIVEEASHTDPSGEEALLHWAQFRMSNVAVTVQYRTEDTALPDEDLMLVTRISEGLEESIDATAE